MCMLTPPDDRAPRPRAEVRSLLAALLVFAALLIFTSACGSGDLTFPGNVPATATPQFTETPTP